MVNQLVSSKLLRKLKRLGGECRASQGRLNKAPTDEQDYKWSQVRKCFSGRERSLLDEAPWDVIDAMARELLDRREKENRREH